MHYYQHHIGDFLKDTGHLSNEQLAVYMKLLWRYYLDEKPLEDDCEMLAFAVRSDEKTVRLLLRHFFVLTDDGWRQTRCDKVIQDYHEKSHKASDSAKARWNKANAMRTHTERNADEPKNDANHKPITNNQEPMFIETTSLVDNLAVDRPPQCPTEKIVDLYHRHLPMCPRVEVMSDTRKKSVSARWRQIITDKEIAQTKDPRQSALEYFDWYFAHAAKSAFLSGRAKDWKADFDFLMNATKFVKVVEGHYHKEKA